MMNAQKPLEVVSPDQFWATYFRNGFLTLSRGNDGYAGSIALDSETGQVPAGLLRDVRKTDFSISLSSLRAYDYAKDGRFSLEWPKVDKVGDHYNQVLSQTYEYRSPAPFGKKRMAELFTELKAKLLGNGPSTLRRCEEEVISLVDRYSDGASQPLAALAWFLGEQRQRSSSKALMAIVRNASFAGFAKFRIHFSAVDAALSGLWKVNDKTILGELLELMKASSDLGHRKIAPLFERLLSTTDLLSLEKLEEAYFRPEYWEDLLKQVVPGAEDWDDFDARSLFWEIRFLSAIRISFSHHQKLDVLANDEVPRVARVARERLSNGA